MKRNFLVILTLLAGAAFAAAQAGAPTSDVLGAHLNYGRGCAACHAPHSGAWGNGIGTTDTKTGSVALWGEDVSKLVGVTIVTGQSEHATYSETLPGITTTAGAEATGLLMCLSCHDGNLAASDMMKGTTVETVSIAGVTFNPPTLVGNGESTAGSYMNGHPVGPGATISCGGKKDWDCAVNADGSITFAGPKGRAFVADYFDVTGGDGPLNHLVKVPGSTASGTTVTSKS